MASKVDWITWKTETKEIINPAKVQEELDACFQEFNQYITPLVYDQLKDEMRNGGLSRDAFNISGVSPAYEMALDIVAKIDEVKETFKELKEYVEASLEEQRKIEKKQLIDEIQKNIDKEKIILDSVKSSQGVKQHICNMGENPEDIIYIISDRIRKLKERLELAKNL